MHCLPGSRVLFAWEPCIVCLGVVHSFPSSDPCIVLSLLPRKCPMQLYCIQRNGTSGQTAEQPLVALMRYAHPCAYANVKMAAHNNEAVNWHFTRQEPLCILSWEYFDHRDRHGLGPLLGLGSWIKELRTV